MDEKQFVRFEAKYLAEPTCGCWLWSGSVNSKGYALLGIERKAKLAHRLSYEHFIGIIPKGMQIDHLCRVRCCVNPHHLEPVPARVNILRGIGPTRQNADKTHCIRGHALAGDNLFIKDGKRQCRECTAENQRTARKEQRRKSGDAEYRRRAERVAWKKSYDKKRYEAKKSTVVGGVGIEPTTSSV